MLGLDQHLHVAYEILNFNDATRHSLDDVLQLSNRLDDSGSVRLEDCLSKMVQDHVIDRATAVRAANDPDRLAN